MGISKVQPMRPALDACIDAINDGFDPIIDPYIEMMEEAAANANTATGYANTAATAASTAAQTANMAATAADTAREGIQTDLAAKADKTGTYSTLTAGGTTPDSVTDTMLKQTGGVLKDVADLADGTFHLSGYVVGTLNSSGDIAWGPYAISSNSDIVLDYPAIFEVANGYRYRLLFKLDGSTYKDSGYVSYSFTIPANTPFKVTVLRTGDTSTPADIPVMSRKLLVVTDTSYKASNLSAQVDKLKSGEQLIDAYFTRGSLTNGTIVFATYRVATWFVVRYNRPLTFHVKNGFRYALHTFDDEDTFESDIGWKAGDYAIEANQGFKIVIARVTEDTTEVADIDEFSNAVSIDTEFRQSVNDMAGANIFKMPYMQEGKPKLVAHMGYHVDYPENTIPAFKAAGEAGMWGVETDIQQTSDGYFVCMHDNSVDRTTNGTGNVADMTLSEIRALHIKDHDDLQVPTFEEFLGICKAYGLIPQIEIKTVPNTPEAISRLVAIVKHYALDHQSMFSGSKWMASSFRAATSDIPYIGIFQHAAYSDYGPEIEFMKGFPLCGVALEVSGTITSDMIQTCHDSNMPVCTFVVDTVDGVIAQFAAGADMVTTNQVSNLS